MRGRGGRGRAEIVKSLSADGGSHGEGEGEELGRLLEDVG